MPRTPVVAAESWRSSPDSWAVLLPGRPYSSIAFNVDMALFTPFHVVEWIELVSLSGSQLRLLAAISPWFPCVCLVVLLINPQCAFSSVRRLAVFVKIPLFEGDCRLHNI